MTRLLRLAAACIACVSASGASAKKAIQPAANAQRCLPPRVFAGADIVLLGIYGGFGTMTPIKIDGSSHRATAVAVAGSLRRPMVLMLAAYEPTIWDLSGIPAGKIRAVYSSGYYGQAITGLPKLVPIVFRNSAFGNAPDSRAADSACPDLKWPYKGGLAKTAAAEIYRAFGMWPAHFYGSYGPFSFKMGGGKVPKRASVPTPGNVRAELLLIPDPLPVWKGLPMPKKYAGRWKRHDRQEAEAARDGRRLRHISWDTSGRIVENESELFGRDHGTEQISQDTSRNPADD